MIRNFIAIATCTLTFASPAFADSTSVGKIIYTQGHVAPSCRTVQHKENATGQIRNFRIQEIAGKDDVGAIVLSALLANRDVAIVYDPAQTTGCGGEPKILYVTIY
jgi:hypothetical protein